MMTHFRTSLCASWLLAAFAWPAGATPTPADFGASVLTKPPSCMVGRPDTQLVAAVFGARPTCCMSGAQCSQYLATTRINREHARTHT
jgi:hypothetical protein